MTTPLEACAIAYVRAVRTQEPGTVNEAYRALVEKADAVERRTPTTASKLPDARTVVDKVLPPLEEVADPTPGLVAAREALRTRNEEPAL